MESILSNISKELLKGFCKPFLMLTLAGIAVSGQASARQSGDINTITDLLQTYSCAQQQKEKLFVFLNSGFYYPGEKASFYAVLFDNNMKIKTDGSCFFYVQLTSKQGTTISNYTFRLQSGTCSGTINIPDTLITGLYHLRAYTRWMQNYSPSNCFRRPVLVISPASGTTLYVNVQDSLPVHFYPESGHLISGANNTVLVRKAPFLPDTIFSLNIVDDQGNAVSTCNMDKNGVGSFSFTPEPGKKYYAFYDDTTRSKQLLQLPVPLDRGYSMKVSQEDEYIHINFASAPGEKSDETLGFIILTENPGQSVIRKINISLHQAILTIPVRDLADGLNQLVLTDTDTILCSRLWYRKNGLVTEEIINHARHTGTRETVAMDDMVNGLASMDTFMLLSVNEYNPVTDSILFNEINYFRYFDLYSSLPHPEILPIFNEETPELYINQCLLAYPLDLSLGYALHPDQKQHYIKEREGIVLSGKLVFNSTGLPVKRASVLLSYPDSVAHLNYCITNEAGEYFFKLNEKLYNKKIYMVVQDYPQAENAITILQDNPFEINDPDTVSLPLLNTRISGFVSSHLNIAMAYRVFYPVYAKEPVQARQKIASYTGDFFGNPDFTLIPAEYESLPDIFEIRKNLVPKLKIKVRNDYCYMTVFDDYLQLFQPQEAMVLLNNIPYPSFKNILELNSESIRSIEMKNYKYFYDNYLMYGILSIKTTKPVVVEPYYCYSITSVDVYSEVLSGNTGESWNNRTLPDVRHSLYWSSAVQTGKKYPGISFISSDIKGKYQLKLFYRSKNGMMHVAGNMFTVH
jgi:hypothetical protein